MPIPSLRTMVRLWLLVAAMLPLLACPSQQPRDSLPDYHQLAKTDLDREGGHLVESKDLLVQGPFRGSPVRWVTNSKGFRNEREFGHEVPSGRRRILLIGDSFVDGLRTDQDDIIGYQLERRLNEGLDGGSKGRFEVLNAGENNPVNYWFYYQTHGRKYHPEHVMMGLTLGNDITWHTGEEFIGIERDGQGRDFLELRVEEFRHEHVNRLAMRETVWLPPRAFSAPSLVDHYHRFLTRLYAWLAVRFDRFAWSTHAPTMPKRSRRRHVVASGWFVSFGLFYEPMQPAIRKRFEYVKGIIRGFHEQVRADGRRFTVLIFPTRIQVDGDHWQATVRAYGLDASKFDLLAPNRELHQFFTRHAIDYVDLTEPLRAEREQSEEPLFLPLGDMHFSPHAQRVVARAVAERELVD